MSRITRIAVSADTTGRLTSKTPLDVEEAANEREGETGALGVGLERLEEAAPRVAAAPPWRMRQRVAWRHVIAGPGG
jgi:hypothetical protein